MKYEQTAEQGKLLARPWDVVVCRNNHPCFLAVKEIRNGDFVSVTAFLAIGETKPLRTGTLVSDTKCPECNESVFGTGWPTIKVLKRVEKQDEETRAGNLS